MALYVPRRKIISFQDEYSSNFSKPDVFGSGLFSIKTLLPRRSPSRLTQLSNHIFPNCVHEISLHTQKQTARTMPRPHLPPHPSIKWRDDEEPFKSNTRYLDWRNEATWKSATIRGDPVATLHRVIIKSGPYKGYDPEGFDVNEQEMFLHRNLPMRNLPRQPIGLDYEDPISEEVNVPYTYHKSNPAPSKQNPQIYDGVKLEWIEDLGKGGFGLASLWKATFEDGVTMKVVIKSPIDRRDSRDAFADEKRWHLRYRHSKNISQSLDLCRIAESHMKDPNKKTKGSKGKYNDGNTIALEYMEHGCLNQLNRNIAYHGWQKRWSRNALWQLYAGREYISRLSSPRSLLLTPF